MQQKDFILRTWPFLLVASIYCIIGLTLDKYYGEVELHLLQNQYHNPFADVFFTYYTRTGEWIFGLLVLGWLVYTKTWRVLYMYVSATVLQFLLVQTLKRSFFIDHLRPAHFFQELGTSIYLVEGIHQGITFTFPSGHTATAFFLFGFLSLFVENNIIKLLFGIAAILAAYSRIYLSQHFMIDTVGGAFIGIFCLICSYYIWQNIVSPHLDKTVIAKNDK